MNTNIVHGRRFRRSTAKRSGFVLVMTLVLIVIVAITTVSLARVSLQRAIMAVDAQAELDHEWAAKSCRLVLLDGADELFEGCLLYTSPSPRDGLLSRMPSSA